MSSWDVTAAITYLDAHGGKQHSSTSNCARATREAIGAGGVHLTTTHYAKDYGMSLLNSGFQDVGQTTDFQRGDIAVIQPLGGKHPEGHMCMFDGERWISDFAQTHGAGIDGMYPGPQYRLHKPSYKIYRM
jgi:hypothetical protein